MSLRSRATTQKWDVPKAPVDRTALSLSQSLSSDNKKHHGKPKRKRIRRKLHTIMALGFCAIISLLLIFCFEEEEVQVAKGIPSTDAVRAHVPPAPPVKEARSSVIKSSSSSSSLEQVGVTTSAKKKNTITTTNTKDTSATGATRKAVYIIAVVPDSKERLQALWSQLECFYDEKKFQGIVVAAPNWAKEENILAPFLQKAMDNIPHLKGVDLAINYHNNDRYDVGLWCDSLNGEHENGSLLENYNDFVIANDSIMAVRGHFTKVLDVLREKNLTLTSLNFSELDGYWVESAMRGFTQKGMRVFMEHACVPATHDRWCPESSPEFKDMETYQRKRCIVDNFEIAIARLFPRNKVFGIYPADVPEDMVGRGFMNDGKTWINHYKYWIRVLRHTYNFPAMKISSPNFLLKIRMPFFAKKAGPVWEACTKDMDASFLLPMEERIKQYGNRLDPYVPMKKGNLKSNSNSNLNLNAGKEQE